MSKFKYQIGQSVHFQISKYGYGSGGKKQNMFGKIVGIEASQHVSHSSNGQKRISNVVYKISVSPNSGTHSVKVGDIFGDKSDFYIKQRNKEKAKAKAKLTRAQKSLEKNQNKIKELKKKLANCKEV